MALAIVALIVVAGVVAVVAGTSGWNRASEKAVAKLTSSPITAAATYRAGSYDSLPPPVERFFRAVLTDGHPIVRSATATQEAEFFINGSWRPLRATQHFTTRRRALSGMRGSRWRRSCPLRFAMRTSEAGA
jgi:hypothetical protein